MDWLKQKVSGPKNRYQEDNFNLDLTYITPRLIAMAYPADKWIEKIYRNSIEDVSQLIRKRHQENYLIINLSQRKYDTKYFGDDKVKDYEWEDHHSPSLKILFEICESIQDFLIKNKDNVAVAHCKAGKGRTGTIISCFLMYSGMFDNPEEALTYYSKQRFKKDGLGVNQPCQIRYVYYFWLLLKSQGKIKYPVPRSLDSISLDYRPNISHGGCRPYVVIQDVNTNTELYNTKRAYNDQDGFYEGLKFKINLDQKTPPVLGDILVKFYNNSRIKNQKIFRLAFNAYFVQPNNVIVFSKSELSPSQVQNDDRIPDQFKLQLNFKLLCNQCDDKLNFSKKCGMCQQIYSQKKLDEDWKLIFCIIEKYAKPNKQQTFSLLFGENIQKLEEFQTYWQNFQKSLLLPRPKQFCTPIIQVKDDFEIQQKINHVEKFSPAKQQLELIQQNYQEDENEQNSPPEQNKIISPAKHIILQQRSSSDHDKPVNLISHFEKEFDSSSEDENIQGQNSNNPELNNMNEYQLHTQDNELKKIDQNISGNENNSKKDENSENNSPLK